MGMSSSRNRNTARVLVLSEQFFAVFNEADDYDHGDPTRPTKNMTSSRRIAKIATIILQLYRVFGRTRTSPACWGRAIA
jgi:hypothetical protein